MKNDNADIHHASLRATTTDRPGRRGKESVLIGAAATVIGLAGGVVFLRWMLASLATTTLPDVGISLYVSPSPS